MTKKEVLDYVMNTPYNPNRAVLSGMLDSFEAGDNKEEIELSATENKVYTPDEGKVYKKVTVNVPIKTEVSLSATENTTYTPAEGTVYNSVTVNVPAPTPGSECEILEFTVDDVTGYYTSVKTVGEIIEDNATTPQGILFEQDFNYRATGMGAQATIVGGSVYKLNYVKENVSVPNYTLCFVTTGLIDHDTSVVDFNEASDSYITLQPYS